MLYTAAIFDLDGVIVDTAKYHYMAWRKLAEKLGFDFPEEKNELLKGVSRMRSLDILLECGGLEFDEDTKLTLAEQKNQWYRDYISRITEEELLPGAREIITFLKDEGIRTAVASASKNTGIILDNLRISHLFDAIVDGNRALRAKPDPQVFMMAANELGVSNNNCVVFEDAIAGIEGARLAGMFTVGIGKAEVLSKADMVVESLKYVNAEKLFAVGGQLNAV